jgi:hypothetical protein
MFAPGDSRLAQQLKNAFGSISSIVIGATTNESNLKLVVWSAPEAVSRDRRWLRRAFRDDEFGGEHPWPRVAFSTRESLPGRVTLEARGSGSELVSIGSEPDIWIHFVGMDPSSGRTLPRVQTWRYDDALQRGVWGIEEDYFEGGSSPGGWWVTSTNDPGPTPQERHSIC